MDVSHIRSLYHCHYISGDQRSDSEFLSVPLWRALLCSCANAGDLCTFYEDTHFDQPPVRAGDLAFIQTPKISAVAAAYYSRLQFRIGNGDPLPSWDDSSDSVPISII